MSAIRRWWRDEGSLRYPRATRLLVTCDAGGANGWRSHQWRDHFAVLAAETGLRARGHALPARDEQVEQDRAPAVLPCHPHLAGPAPDDRAGRHRRDRRHRHRPGPEITAVLDDGHYPAGLTVPPGRVRELEARWLDRSPFHGEWNYALLPVPRPAPPEPEPGPRLPGRVPAAVLSRPALTGTRPQDLAALAEALDGPFEARLAQRNYRLRKGPRGNRARAGGPSANRRLSLTDHLLAYALRRHLKLPGRAVGALLGVSASSANSAAALAAELLAAACLTLPAAPPPEEIPRTPAALLAHARANGIPLTLPENGYTMPEQFRTRTNRATRDTPETHN